MYNNIFKAGIIRRLRHKTNLLIFLDSQHFLFLVLNVRMVIVYVQCEAKFELVSFHLIRIYTFMTVTH